MTDEPIKMQWAEVPPARHSPPPLRIHHLLACCLIAAVQLVIWRALLPHQVWPRGALILQANNVILSATSLAAGIFSIYWHARGYAGLSQPGQWLPFVFAAPVLRVSLMALSWDVLLYRVDDTLFYGLPFVLFSWCTWRIADTWPWRILCAMTAIGPLLLFAVPLSWFFLESAPAPFMDIAKKGIAGGAAALIVTAWAVIDDCWCGRRRAWTHWVGTGWFIALLLQLIVGGFIQLSW